MQSNSHDHRNCDGHNDGYSHINLYGNDNRDSYDQRNEDVYKNRNTNSLGGNLWEQTLTRLIMIT